LQHFHTAVLFEWQEQSQHHSVVIVLFGWQEQSQHTYKKR
jgi:hypothetical protein